MDLHEQISPPSSFGPAPAGFTWALHNPAPMFRELSVEARVWRNGTPAPAPKDPAARWILSPAVRPLNKALEMEAGSMHLTLTAAQLEESEVLALAKRFGLLAWNSVTDPLNLEDWGGKAFGDLLADWYDLIGSLRLMGLLSEYLRSRSPSTLDSFYAEADQSWSAPWTQTALRGWSERLGSYAQLRCADGPQAEEYFAVRLNAMLQETVSIQYETWPPRLTVSALGVAGIAVAAFARSLTGETGIARQCPGCGRWYMARHGSSRH